MVKYYGRARQRIGSVNTNQLGLKMSGCPSRVGRNPVNARYIKQRVNCMQGTCGPIQIHGVNVPSNKFRNNPPYCKKRSTTCLAAAGGIGNINTPYYRTPAPGEKGCGCKFGSCDGGFGGFVLKAGTNPSIPFVGYISPSFSSYSGAPAFGSLKGEDASPIQNKDILYFFPGPNAEFSGNSVYTILLKFTPEVKKYLASKVMPYPDAQGRTIYNIDLNINGKEYPNCGGEGDDEIGGFVALFFCPYTDPLTPYIDIPPFKQGETYNFSFK